MLWALLALAAFVTGHWGWGLVCLALWSLCEG